MSILIIKLELLVDSDALDAEASERYGKPDVFSLNDYLLKRNYLVDQLATDFSTVLRSMGYRGSWEQWGCVSCNMKNEE